MRTQKLDLGRPDTGAELVSGYEAWMTERGRAEGTARKYARIVRATLEFVEGWGWFLTATREDALALIGLWKSRKRETPTEWRVSVSSFFSFLVAEGLRADNPLAELPPATSKTVRAGWPATPVPEFERLRDRAALMLLMTTDLRPEELWCASVGCYRQSLARLTLRTGRRVLLDGPTARALEEYLALPRGSARNPEPLTPYSPLFVDPHSGGALPENHYWTLIRQNLRLAAGVSGYSSL
jgi:site-specific recombinase XerD